MVNPPPLLGLLPLVNIKEHNLGPSTTYQIQHPLYQLHMEKYSKTPHGELLRKDHKWK